MQAVIARIAGNDITVGATIKVVVARTARNGVFAGIARDLIVAIIAGVVIPR